MPSLLTRLVALVFAATATQACADPVSSAIYPAPKAELSLAGLPQGSRFLDVTTEDGLTLRGIHAEGRAEKPVLLHFHGNASSAQTALAWLAPLHAEGFTIVSGTYRGYSRNPGGPSEAGLLKDGRAFLAAARAIAGQRPVWVVGHSLGGGVALGLSRETKLDAVVTIGTFTRIRDMAPRLVRGLVPDAYRNGEAVKALDEPFFLIHGSRDGVVSADMGKALFDLARGKQGRAFVIRTADHVPPAEDLRLIFAAIEATLANRPLPPAPGHILSMTFAPSAP